MRREGGEAREEEEEEGEEEEKEKEGKKERETKMERKKTFIRRNFRYFLIAYEWNTDQPSQFSPSHSVAHTEDRAPTIIGYDV